MAGHVFCSDVCRERGEPLAGTGDAPERVLMLAWPRGKWRVPRWESVDMGEALKKALHDAVQSDIHLALVDKVESETDLPTLHALPENIRADFADEDAIVAAIRAYVKGTVFSGTRDPRTTILCCTDSRRDACCARHGFSTYKALVAAADPARFHVVQATHLGGCRFAASLVVMPQRQRYGRMSAGQAPAFLDALERGAVYLPAYKGRTDQPEPMQVAEIAAMGWAQDHGLDMDAVVLDAPALPHTVPEGTSLTLGAAIGSTRLAIRLSARRFLMQGNCSIVAKGGGVETMRWCLDAVQPEAAG
ncbi:MAG: hypothetical protein ABS76_10080 [Pelagibacterium sp. SCN 64-44]|nr:MAG: hypothetical protein ABS76_10080 [Pelagibacterium sp. SCN 64-44]